MLTVRQRKVEYHAMQVKEKRFFINQIISVHAGRNAVTVPGTTPAVETISTTAIFLNT